MSKSQRDKGKRGENEIAQLFRRGGWWAERTRQSEGDSDPDVRVRFGEGLAEVPIHVEVKRRARIATLRWYDQASRESPKSHRSVVFLREDGCTEWRILVAADFFMDLLSTHPLYSVDYALE